MKKRNALFCTVLAMMLLAGCASQTGDVQPETVQETNKQIEYGQTENAETVEPTESEELLEPTQSPEMEEPAEPIRIGDSAEIDAKYLEYLQPADDDIDFMFASDYEYFDMIDFEKGKDSCSYEAILGIADKVTVSDIEEVLASNDAIAPEYKEFIITYVTDWLELYPESDFRVLYHNLKTLEILTVTESDMMISTMSTGAAACYLREENQILLLDGEDFLRETDNYIILTHELTHCARSTRYGDADGTQKSIGYYDYHLMGTYAEEGIITNIAYELQGLGKRADFYPIYSSFYRIVMDCVDYTAEDFLNHGVNYLIYKMDEFMGDEQYAYYIVALMDSHGTKRYADYMNVDYTYYQDAYDYITRMYMKKYLSPDMSLEEAEAVFEAFCDNIMHGFDWMKRTDGITADTYRPAFEACLEEYGITP